MKMIIIMCTLFIFASCSKDEVRENSAQAFSDAATPVIAKIASCEGHEAISRDVKEEAVRFLGGENKKSLNLVCKAAASAIIPAVAGIGQSKLPEDWECSLESLEGKTSEIADEACQKL